MKRRAAKAFRFDDYHREALRDGPEEVLIAGAGYMHGEGCAVFGQLPPADRERILDNMRDDWRRHGRDLIAGWRRDGLTSPSWAETTFGRPRL